MKVLAKWKTCTMTLLAGVLFIIATATGDNQTELSTGGVKQMAKKPTVMILGSAHLANPGMDVYNTKMDDVLAPKRQREIEQLVTQIKEFHPTKVAIEADERFDAKINADYHGYLEGTYELKRGEGNQIGFRLAKQMGHPKMYCVDYWPERWPILEKIDDHLIDRYAFAEANNQEHFLRPPPVTKGKIVKDKDGTTWIEPEEYQSMIEMYIEGNEPEGIRADHREYLRSARIGLGDQYPGANWVAHSWYARNLKIFVNLTRITESADDRILLIIGGGHVFLVQQFLEDSGDYIIESPLKYLKVGRTN